MRQAKLWFLLLCVAGSGAVECVNDMTSGWIPTSDPTNLSEQLCCLECPVADGTTCATVVLPVMIIDACLPFKTAAPTNAPPTNPPDTLPPPTNPPPTNAPPTNPPPTPSPPTPAPPTDPPLTNPPATDAPPTLPPTDAPPTPKPISPVPATPAPDTAVPTAVPTQAPLTDPPATIAPTAPPTTPPTISPSTAPTPSPTSTPTTIPTDVPTTAPTSVPTSVPIASTMAPVGVNRTIGEDEQKIAAGVVVGAAVAGGGAAGAASLIALSVMPCKLPDKDHFPLLLHPTRLEVGGSIPVGVIFGNVLIGLGVAISAKILLVIVRLLRMKIPMITYDTEATFFFPAAPLLVLQVLYEGLVMASFTLIIRGNDARTFMLSVVTVLVCIAMPVTVFWRIVKGVPARGRYLPDVLKPRGALAVFMLGKGEWMSLRQENHWVKSLSCFLVPFAPHAPWFSIVDYTVMMLLGLISSFETETNSGCGTIKVLSAILCFFLACLVAVLRPYAKGRDNLGMAVVYLFTTTSLGLKAAAYFTNDFTGSIERMSEVFGQVAFFTLLAKLVLDMIFVVYIAFSCRREALQDHYWRKWGELHTQKGDGSTEGQSIVCEEELLGFEPDYVEHVASLASLEKDMLPQTHSPCATFRTESMRNPCSVAPPLRSVASFGKVSQLSAPILNSAPQSIVSDDIRRLPSGSTQMITSSFVSSMLPDVRGSRTSRECTSGAPADDVCSFKL